MKTPGYSIFSRFLLAVFLCTQLVGVAPLAVAGEMPVLMDESGISFDDNSDGKVPGCSGLTPDLCFVGAIRQGHHSGSRQRLTHATFVANQGATGPPKI